MGWYGVFAAIEGKDFDMLLRELSPRNNPNDPGTALELACREVERKGKINETLAWIVEQEREEVRRKNLLWQINATLVRLKMKSPQYGNPSVKRLKKCRYVISAQFAPKMPNESG